MQQHEALPGVIKLRLVTISLQMAVALASVAVAAAVVIFRCHHRNIGMLVFRYQLV